MQKWEYCTSIVNYESGTFKSKWTMECRGLFYSSVGEMLDDVGDKGWELVSVSAFLIYNNNGHVYMTGENFYFKRPKE